MTGMEKIQRCRRIVERWTAEKIDGVLMDATTASYTIQVYDKLNEENQQRLLAMMEKDIVSAVDLVWNVVAGRLGRT